MGFENELIGQSNFPRQPREVPSLAALFPDRPVLKTPWIFVPKPTASGREYAANGPVYARRKRDICPHEQGFPDAPLVEWLWQNLST
jgi:hypothetical protein